MNFFFTINNAKLESNLTIPVFRNDGILDLSYVPYKASIKKNRWQIRIPKYKFDNNFFMIDRKELNNKSIFFLNKKSKFFLDGGITYEEEIKNYNTYTKTIPEFRANLRIYNKLGGFSSYQSEYPFDMTIKKGEVVSPISTLLNFGAEDNLLFFKNIYFKPIHNEFNVFFINLKSRKVIYSAKCITNSTNEIKVSKNLIKQDIYFYSENFIGVPMFVSISKGHISFEHTHPPHLYLLSDNKFQIIRELKSQFSEIVNQNNC